MIAPRRSTDHTVTTSISRRTAAFNTRSMPGRLSRPFAPLIHSRRIPRGSAICDAQPPRQVLGGGPDECREQMGVGVVDLSFQTPGSEHPDQLMEALELFGKKVLPHIRNV